MQLVQKLALLAPTFLEILKISGTPGLSIGVLHKGNVIHTAHFGHRDSSSTKSPDDNTVFYIASLTKAITAAAVGRLVEDNKVSWDSPIADILPGFKSRRDNIGERASLVDVLSHRTGLTGANALWIQRNQEFMMPKNETVNTTAYIDAVKPFRETFHYNNWGYGLATAVIEKITQKSYGTYVNEAIFEPLSMTRTTIGTPSTENRAAAYMLYNDGTPCEIPPPPNGDTTGLAGAGGGKSTIKDLLLMYKAMLASYRHQEQNNSTSTPDSPFKQMETIFGPKIAIGSSNIVDESYALGWVRSKLPAKLGLIGMNEAFLGHEKMPVIGKGSTGTVVLHHNGNLVGTLSSVHLIPETETAILVMTNSMAFTDPTDWIGQLILETVLGEEQHHDFIELSHEVRKASFEAYSNVIVELDRERTDQPPTQSLAAYEGKYYNKAQNFVLEITRHGDGLRMMAQGMIDVVYNLQIYDGDTFYWPADREEELCKQRMFPWTWPGVHKIHFSGEGYGNMTELAWKHDPANVAEIFRRTDCEPSQAYAEQQIIMGS